MLDRPPNFPTRPVTIALDLERTQGPAYDAIAHLSEVLIVHSQQLLGDALEVLLSGQPDMIVVGKLKCGPDAVRQVDALTPNVAIIDFRANMPAAIEVALKIRRRKPETAVVALLRDGAKDSLLSAIEVGASAVISESDDAESVVTTARRAARGLMLIHSDTIASLLRRRRFRDEPTRRLTRREAQVLGLLAQGIPSQSIAGLMRISYFTVRTHIRNLSVKLAAHSKLELVAKAYELELIRQPHNPGEMTDLA